MRLEEQFCKNNNGSEKKKETYIVQLNCHIWREFSTDLERDERHTQSGNSWMGLPRFLKRRMISPRLAAVQKLNKISGGSSLSKNLLTALPDCTTTSIAHSFRTSVKTDIISVYMRQTHMKILQGDHPWPRVLLLDRLRGHLGVLVSDDLYGRIKRKGRTKIELWLDQHLYFRGVAIVRKDKKQMS